MCRDATIIFDGKLINSLAVRYFAGEAGVRDAFVEAGLSLAGHMAQKVVRRATRVRCEYDDMVQDGMLGYLHAMDLYEAGSTASFLTYAYWWVRQAMFRGITNCNRSVRVPVHAVEYATARRRFARGFLAARGRDPGDAEVSAATGLTTAQLRLADLADRLDAAISRGTEIGDGAGVLTTGPEQDPANIAAHHEATERVAGWLRKLHQRDAFVLTRRFDLDEAGDPCTLDELGARMAVTRERVRQLEARGLAQIVKVAGWPAAGVANKVAVAHLRRRRESPRAAAG